MQNTSITKKYVTELSSSFIGKTIPGSSICASLLKTFCKGFDHINRIRGDKFNKSFKHAKVHLNFFNSAAV